MSNQCLFVKTTTTQNNFIFPIGLLKNIMFRLFQAGSISLILRFLKSNAMLSALKVAIGPELVIT